MIPIKLQLKNFLSYGPQLQEINFGHYPLICLSGKNGHGKSALLDAMTWAIWGHARKTSNTARADQGLLRLGQTEMMVIFEFEYNAHNYRIRREFSYSHGKAHTALDFGVFDITKKAYVPLTDKTIRKTQETIEHTIHLDFESFINSAFLRQGHANEFSQKMPKERKEILATILGLNRYEQVRKRASEKVRTCTAQHVALSALQEKRVQELEHHAIVTTHLAQVTEQLAAIIVQKEMITIQTHELQQKWQRLIADKKRYELLQLQLEHLTQKELEQQEQLRTYRAQWRMAHAKLLQYSTQPDFSHQKEQLVQQIKEHQHLLQKNLELKEQLLHGKEKLQQLRHQLLTQHSQQAQLKQMEVERLLFERNNNQEQINQYTAQQATAEQEKSQCANTLEHLDKQRIVSSANIKEGETELKQFEKRKEHYQQFIAQGNWVKKELDGLQQKKLLVHNEEAPSCPLCEQNLSASRRRFLKNKFAHTEQFLTHRLKRLSSLITKLKAILIEQHSRLQQIKTGTEQTTMMLMQAEQVQKTYQSLTATITKLTSEKNACVQKSFELEKIITHKQAELVSIQQSFERMLEQDDAYTAQARWIMLTETTMATMYYDPKAHEQANKELQLLEQQEISGKQLLQEQTYQQQRTMHIQQQCMLLKSIKQEKKELEAALTHYLQLLIDESELIHAIKKIEQERSILSKAKEQLLQEKGRLTQQHKQLMALEAEHKQQEAMLKQLDESIDDYHAIAIATGKDGIQALLIEDALPEIEHEANKLLAKLTDNQAHIIIESLRDLKKGGTRETLDIKVSDTMGIRPYELFSGGEAFRIDFALRIAISKLLARRAGASLQTLIIDEGFGSQDEDGLSKIMDAIYKIQDDFAKVIIVSHLMTMKDQFPIHFVINKGPNGSVVSVVEQG